MLSCFEIPTTQRRKEEEKDAEYLSATGKSEINRCSF